MIRTQKQEFLIYVNQQESEPTSYQVLFKICTKNSHYQHLLFASTYIEDVVGPRKTRASDDAHGYVFLLFIPNMFYIV